ncbi:unnamed protein product [Hermetia illucens]|uniref:Cytochrome P450 n=1 Tax=Hermetia illucens TaxID=343691 RepID=A0A7R8V0L0_HERIL|nr:probable cytochrome P450 6a14 [Hermetia illucens]CAD7090006.1 unnamed protein product [Hermetia illucens]
MEWCFPYIFIFTFLSAIYVFFKWKLSFWERRDVPTLPPSIPFGNVKGVGQTHHMKDLIDKVYRAFKDKSPIAGAYFAVSPVLIITDLDLAKNILIKDFNYFIDRPIYCNEDDDPLSGHMFALKGEKWRNIRSKLTPTFTSGKMKFMFPTIVDVADKFSESLKSAVKTDGVLEMKDWLARYTTDVIGRCAFGIECSSLEDPKVKFREMGQKAFDDPRHSQFVESIIWQFPNLCRTMGIKVVRDDVTEFFMGIVRDTLAYREENDIHRNDFMDLLIELQKSEGKLTVEEIAAQVYLFFIAGFETSSTTLSYALYELALNEDVQNKAREEINAVLEKHNGQLTYEAMKEMHYIDQIISETLRLYPPVVAIFRQTTENYKVHNTKFVIEKDISVFIPAYSIQRDEEYFENPEIFDPGRFSPEAMKARHPMTFLSFGDGPRNCIGLRFGRMQSSIGLITLLHNFRIKKCSKTVIPMKFSNSKGILSSEGGLYLEVEGL